MSHLGLCEVTGKYVADCDHCAALYRAHPYHQLVVEIPDLNPQPSVVDEMRAALRKFAVSWIRHEIGCPGQVVDRNGKIVSCMCFVLQRAEVK